LLFQTSEDWTGEVRDYVEVKVEKKKKKHRRSASFGHADKKLEVHLEYIMKLHVLDYPLDSHKMVIIVSLS